MTFSITYISSISSESLANDDNLSTTLSSKSIVADFTSKLTFELAANIEQTISLPGLNALIAISVTGTAPISLSTESDGTDPIYDGSPCLHISKFYGNSGVVFDHIKVKAAAAESVVTVTIIGKEALPSP